jgi:hypothetical protein
LEEERLVAIERSSSLGPLEEERLVAIERTSSLG